MKPLKIVTAMLIMLYSFQCIVFVNSVRCLEGGVGRKVVSTVQTNGGGYPSTNSYIEIHNSLMYDDCPDGACICCSYYYNVTLTKNSKSNIQENCVSWTSASSKNCIEETPNTVQGSYQMKTTSCDPSLNDGCNNCFEGSKPKNNAATTCMSNLRILIFTTMLLFTALL
jgi:hypothetical protein